MAVQYEMLSALSAMLGLVHGMQISVGPLVGPNMDREILSH